MTTAAVITSYDPGDDLLDTCRAVASQVDSVIVVDDGSRRDVSALLDTCRSEGWTVLEQGANTGIAAALNRGVDEALASGADAVLTLDQDTVLEPGYVQRMHAHLGLARSLGIDAALLGPSSINGGIAPFWYATEGLTMAFEPIQSGLLIPREVFDRIGGFEEGLFIDCVDTEFYLRARAAGIPSLVTPGARISHQFGRSTRWIPPRLLRRLAGPLRNGFDFIEDAPFRHYYIARNRTIMYRRYWRTEPLWCAVSLVKDGLARGRAIAIGSRRLVRLRLTVAGFRAGLRDESGRIPDRLARLAAGRS
ncbi:glycosyltransferase family 2 protein [Rhodococcus sp. Z13]|uniref:Glycosyltransferase family 2 protein n=1 Tax=Rhodococcus sacchari TaxID=2962047 RepID=A0ACD4DIE9_9NOCA|nr:glycosyltransferase family 2 protein [Rhodococcus sp. Z13]UYP19743.1 glycosyltransferase family 2 protein [Rhodococcus sp. Z13]